MHRFLLVLVLLAACNPPPDPSREPATVALADPSREPATVASDPSREPATVALADPSREPATVEAAAAARAWLKLADDREYGSTYDRADDLFHETTTRDSWIQKLTTVRTPLGARKSLDLNTATYTTTVPGGPDGRYVLLAFASSFENKAKAVETLTFHEAEPGLWRLSGYFIK